MRPAWLRCLPDTGQSAWSLCRIGQARPGYRSLPPADACHRELPYPCKSLKGQKLAEPVLLTSYETNLSSQATKKCLWTGCRRRRSRTRSTPHQVSRPHRIRWVDCATQAEGDAGVSHPPLFPREPWYCPEGLSPKIECALHRARSLCLQHGLAP